MEETVKIRTNNHYRPLLSFFDLTEKQQAEILSVMDQETAEEQQYFIYKGNVECLGDYMRFDTQYKGWHAYRSTSNSSSTLIALNNSNDGVKVGEIVT